jgi:hypothetical protein
LFFSLSSFFLQLLHLYRTVWWLPQSYEQNAVVMLVLMSFNYFIKSSISFILSIFYSEILSSESLFNRICYFFDKSKMAVDMFKNIHFKFSPPFMAEKSKRML